MQRKISESSSYNLLSVYLTFLLGIFNTFIMARLLDTEEWALIILTLSFINIAIFFCNLFPPYAQDTIKYYIPYLSSLDRDTKDEKRGFIFYVYKIRLSAAIMVFLLYLVICTFPNFELRLFEIILIMSPMILSIVIRYLNTSILLAFQKFKLVFFTNLLNILTITICNLLIYFYKLKSPLILISYAYLFGAIISCIVSVIMVIPFLPIKKSGEKIALSYKKEFYAIHKEYGTYLIIANIFSLLSGLIINLLFLNFGDIKFITYLTICQITVISAVLFSSSNPNSYISIFSEINYKKDPKIFKNIFYKLSTFLILFNCIVIAIMLFYIELYIVVIYSPIYFIILGIIQLYLFTSFSRMILNNFLILTQSTNNTKIDAEFAFIEMISDISITFIALIFFNFYILILLYVINSYLMTFIMFYFIKRKIDLKLKLLHFFKPFILFIISYLITYPIISLIVIQISEKPYINFLMQGTIKFVTFILVFYILIYITKLITKEEFNKLIEIIPILNSKNSIIQKIVELVKFFLPSKK